jgi:carbon monoxide dehydrogenase subunit G
MTPLEGSRTLPFPQDRVAASLSDAAFLVATLDRVEQVVESAAGRAVWKTRLGSGLFSSSVTVTLDVTAREVSVTRFKAVSKGAGGGGTADVALQFQPVDGGTEVHYRVDVVERTGFMKIVSQGMIHAAANAVIDETWSSVERKLAAGA